MPEEFLQALRDGSEIPDARLEVLRRFTEQVVEHRGRVQGDALAAFVSAGYQPAQAMEVIVGVAMKTMSNYVNHVAEIPLDEAWQDFAWVKPVASHS
ncbi:MAG: carboxymuconolactone decarboxylase family protein [Planctomycetota bacterium]